MNPQLYFNQEELNTILGYRIYIALSMGLIIHNLAKVRSIAFTHTYIEMCDKSHALEPTMTMLAEALWKNEA